MTDRPKDRVRGNLLKQLCKGARATIFNWDTKDFDALANLLHAKLKESDLALSVLDFVPGPDDGTEEPSFRKRLVILGESLQGVVMMDSGDNMTLIYLPVFCSAKDVALFFLVVNAARRVNPACRILWYGTTRDVFVSDERVAELIAGNLERTYDELDYVAPRKHVLLQMMGVDYYARPLPDAPELERKRYTVKVLGDMLHSLWKYIGMDQAPVLYSGDDSSATISFVTNSKDIIVGDSRSVGLVNGARKSKIVRRGTLVDRLRDHPCFEMIDACRFVLRKMPPEQWEELWRSLRVAQIPTPPRKMLY